MRNKKYVAGLSVFFFLVSMLFGEVLRAQTLPERPDWMPEVEISNSFMTKYIWRGWNFGDRPVMQMEGSLSKYGITAGVWGNYSMNNDKTRDEGRYEEFTEMDYWIDYTFSLGEKLSLIKVEDHGSLEPVSISLGYTYYTFPDVDSGSPEFDSHEIYLGFSYDHVISPSFFWYWDVDSGKGSYYVAGLDYTKELTETISADLGFTTGYIDGQWTEKSGWADMVFSASLDISVFEYFTITPSLAYSLILERETYGGVSENEFYGGIAIAFNY